LTPRGGAADNRPPGRERLARHGPARVGCIPQLDEVTTSRLAIEGERAVAPSAPGLGIERDRDVIGAWQKFPPVVIA